METENNSELYINFAHTVSAFRFINNMIYPATWEISSSIYFGDELENYDEILNNTFIKVKFLFDEIIKNSIFISKENKSNIKNIHNNIVMTPNEPTDDHLCMIFQAKLNALGERKIHFNEIQLKSNDGVGLIFTYSGDSYNHLPDMEDWAKDSIFTDPWWNRNDASTYDIESQNIEDHSHVYDFSFLLNEFKPKIAKIIKPNFKIIKND